MTNLKDIEQASYTAPVNTGGAAFPQFEVVTGERDGHGDAIDAYTVAKGGMTKREYFAAIAMQGLIAKYGSENNSTVPDSVQFADALIEALKGSSL